MEALLLQTHLLPPAGWLHGKFGSLMLLWLLNLAGTGCPAPCQASSWAQWERVERCLASAASSGARFVAGKALLKLSTSMACFNLDDQFFKGQHILSRSALISHLWMTGGRTLQTTEYLLCVPFCYALNIAAPSLSSGRMTSPNCCRWDKKKGLLRYFGSWLPTGSWWQGGRICCYCSLKPLSTQTWCKGC